ncbi:rhomboid-like protein [Streptomyces sp. WAC05950]|uniref:rhomboid-like protein n=1 Tax=Streptomyces sp. WAC05950 TaxID=2487419 RepID=UPI0016523CA1|nr:rhomboid-like protein [Streptomyces sp. WAC05950]
MNSQSPSGAPGRALRALWGYPRRAPLTLAYVCLLLVTHAWIGYGLSAGRSAGVLGYVSTNPDNLRDHPLSALLGSVLFFDGTLTDVASTGFVGTLITLGLGVCCFLAWAERRWGAVRAVAVFLGGHVAATLLTAAVIAVALRQGWYPASVRQELDFGVSYGAQTVLAVGTLALPRWGRLPWVVFVLRVRVRDVRAAGRGVGRGVHGLGVGLPPRRGHRHVHHRGLRLRFRLRSRLRLRLRLRRNGSRLGRPG